MMNKNILIVVLVLVIIIMGIVLFSQNGNLPTPFSNNGTIINTNAEDKAKADTSSGAVLTPPALPN